MSSVDNALKEIQEFFDNTIKTYGTQPQGANWNSLNAQHVRFDQLLKLHPDKTQSFSVIDYGCGYGGLVGYLQQHGYQFTYTGYDITPSAIETARAAFQSDTRCTFTTALADLQPVDYVVSSGIFNMKFAHTPEDAWYQHMLNTVQTQWNLSRKGIAFNSLTGYSDPEYMRADLFYPDPCKVFDFCKRRLSRQVALLHDYGIYDFTLLVRREGGS